MSVTDPLWWRRGPGIRGLTRHFVINLINWRAFELAIGAGFRDVSLIFASDSAWRRVRIFPSDWADRDDAVLIALCNAN